MIILNENEFDNSSYENYHKKRIKFTIDKLNKIGTRNIVEVGGHPLGRWRAGIGKYIFSKSDR